jgi:hypothetical protein
MKNLTLAFLAAAGVLAACGASYAWDTWGQITFYLKLGMSEQQVINTIGFWPNKGEQRTCGSGTAKGGWSCRVLIYGNFSGGLQIYEEMDGGQWYVNNWQAYP